MAYSKLSEELYKLAKSWAGRWTGLARERLISNPTVPGHTPKRLDSIIEVHTRVDRLSAQRFSLRLIARGKGDHVSEYGQGKKLAGAYEYGARPHMIAPRSPKKRLYFYWERIDEVVGPTSVQHPGIAPANSGRGYIQASAQELIRQGQAELRPLAKKAILADLKAAFSSARVKK